MATVIRIEGLGKRYRLGERGAAYKTLRESVMRAVTKPLARRVVTSGESTSYLWALRGVDLAIEGGEVVGVIGRNGAGKTTLLKVLSRITEPTEGRVEIHGRVGSLLEVGTGFHPELTGRDNIFLNGAILGMRRAEILARFDEIVAFAEVERFIDTPVKRYSSGMYLRLAFAVAAHLEPEILLVDEVLAVGDVAFQKKCVGKMGDVARAGRTVLFVSHNLGLVSDLCTRCVQFSQGRVVADGPTREVVTRYLEDGELSSSVDLTDWSLDRSGDGPMRLTRVSVGDRDGNERGIFAFGDEIVFRVGVRARPQARCIVGVAIRDAQGHLILHVNNTDDRATVEMPAELSEIRVRLERVILNDGTYYVTIWLGDELNTLNDRAGNCVAFEVRSAADGHIRSHGFVRQAATWTVVTAPVAAKTP